MTKQAKDKTLKLGIDVGSTTIKSVVTDADNQILHLSYQRHYSNTLNSVVDLAAEIHAKFPTADFQVAVSGSGSLGIAEKLGFLFVQEVVAATKSIKKYIPETQVAIELGGEDGKITFFDRGGIDQRMNETCAGGTGAFIDQMAAVLRTDAQGLNTLAEKHTTIYPIAARCGVFARTDILPLLNEGAPKEDIAASIFQAVVDQTVGGLACGRTIKGKTAFLGGPLSFLPELRKRFIATLKLAPEDVIFPENSQYFVAMGAALLSKDSEVISSQELTEKLENIRNAPVERSEKPLPPLFASLHEYGDFKKAHDVYHASYKELATAKGEVFLGLDAGSTTTKAVLIDKNKNILYSWYGENKGNPLASAVKVLEEIYSLLPAGVKIKASGITGYGEGLIQAALGFDIGEVETIAHYRAAEYFAPGVSFILDIGGQDMKCIYIKNGFVDKIVLNEACSSGCGSFLSTFAESLGLKMNDFVSKALFAENPVDLGTRCTVFMNSKIKQSQKEGASVGDISSGLAYSVVKNALYKVIKIPSIEALGDKIVVQGGTFYNDAVLRALERVIGREVIRPDIAGIMGAFGIALIALEKSVDVVETSLLSAKQLEKFTVSNKTVHCGICKNNCLLTVSTFSGGKKFISGNRCERGAGSQGVTTKTTFNMFTYKYNRLFNYYTPLSLEDAKRGEIGIPRVLNMYEDYPFWFTLLTSLGFRVVLSDASSRSMYNSGLETITSQTVCFPAKMVHGHIINLIKKGLKTIFYPCVPFEDKEFAEADAQFNCPVVASYPEVIRLNMDALKENRVRFLEPFLPIHNLKKLQKRFLEEFKDFRITPKEIRQALKKAAKERDVFRKEIRDLGANIVAEIQYNNGKGIVLAGRPYHLDPTINHGIPDMIAAEGIPVLTEDSVAHLGRVFPFPLRVVDQWVYHSRLYRAANFVAHHDNFEFVQLNSFGCGIDAITTEQVEEILSASAKTYTLLKIDEGSNLGAVKIRIRSLLATMKDNYTLIPMTMPKPFKKFTKDMKNDYTILCPQMSPVHFRLIHDALAPIGYNIEVLPDFHKSMVDEGLRYVHNDACYPAIIVVGQLIAALKSGKYDTSRTALIISQTSGGCRATNYVSFLKAALLKAGFPDVPVIALNMQNMTKESGFKVTPAAFNRLMMGFAYGDLLMRLTNATRPYELDEGAVNALTEKWFLRLSAALKHSRHKDFCSNVKDIIRDFERIPLQKVSKPKVGIVGEILVKFHPGANNRLVSLVEKEGGEAVVPDFLDFIIYSLANGVYTHQYLAGRLRKSIKGRLMSSFIENYYRKPIRKALKNSNRFRSFGTTEKLAQKVSDIVSVCNQMGEGWLLTAEMVELIEEGVPNVVCVQPFACLPNHITGKGVIKELKRRYENANIVAIDYDPGASEVNQINRIKLMMSSAKISV
ncbi:MAG: 2-hydroxyacyl-CoA dehydratase [Alphaproteobacteria bacterium]|nr:2-hydroxyacyl-CoA dehydratase [Alphaproteobacteria bacterium]